MIPKSQKVIASLLKNDYGSPVRMHRGISMRYWLLKSEPDEFSIDQLRERQTEEWTGVRNYMARNFLREMQQGDQFLFYHSSCAVPGVAGIGEIAREAAPDPLQFDALSDYFDPKSRLDAPRWSSVLVKYKRHAQSLISLERLRSCRKLEGFVLLNRGNRLSVLEVPTPMWKVILQLEKQS
jgi:predicted RNA-binding protein with PUA-like domain